MKLKNRVRKEVEMGDMIGMNKSFKRSLSLPLLVPLHLLLPPNLPLPLFLPVEMLYK